MIQYFSAALEIPVLPTNPDYFFFLCGLIITFWLINCMIYGWWYSVFSSVIFHSQKLTFPGDGEHVSLSVGPAGELHAALSGVLPNRR